jgi:hypothetical protein
LLSFIQNPARAATAAAIPRARISSATAARHDKVVGGKSASPVRKGKRIAVPRLVEHMDFIHTI